MCPIWPLHFIILYLLVLAPLWVLCQAVPNLTAKYTPSDFLVIMDDVAYLNVTIEGDVLYNDRFSVDVSNENIASASWVSEHVVPADTGLWHGELEVKGNFIGRTDLRVEVSRGGAGSHEVAGGVHPVVVVRPERVIDQVFIISVAVFVSLIFINFGCAMHWPTVKEVIKRPVGPAIGLAGQFIFMPLMSFALGLAIFPDSGTMRLGMFFTGVSPGGGASNIWTFILGGNLNLSLAMTSISTLASFVLMPAWLFSLGRVVFREAEIVVPYARISQLVVGLFVPLFIGLCLQKWTPKFAAFMVRILKGFSSLLLLFIIVFAIVTNLYIFELFTWQIVVAGMGIPWLGYAAGYAAARALRQPHADALAISIETGLQNTGIAIFLLGYALHQPEADLTTVIPVSVAIMTPVPMIAIYIGQKVWSCVCPDSSRVWETETCPRKSWEKTSKSAQSPNSRASQPLMPEIKTTSETA